MATRRPPLYSMQAGPPPATAPARGVAAARGARDPAGRRLAAAVVGRVAGAAADRSIGRRDPPERPHRRRAAHARERHRRRDVAAPSAPVPPRAPLPGVHVAAGIVVDAGSGRVLWSHRPHAQRPIASLTKLMTALLSEHGGINRRFVVTPAMTGETGYTIGLHAGGKVSVHDMLAAMLIASANDAADALAVHTAGSVKAFVRHDEPRGAEAEAVRHPLLEPERDRRRRQPQLGVGRGRPLPSGAGRGPAAAPGRPPSSTAPPRVRRT